MGKDAPGLGEVWPAAPGTGGRWGWTHVSPYCAPPESPCICVWGDVVTVSRARGARLRRAVSSHHGEQTGQGVHRRSPGLSCGCVFTAEPTGHRVGQVIPGSALCVACPRSWAGGGIQRPCEGGKTARRLWLRGLPTPRSSGRVDRMGAPSALWLRTAGPPCLSRAPRPYLRLAEIG